MSFHTSPSEYRPLGRPREFDMDRVLDAAVTVFRQRGYNATSVAELRGATGLTAGSLYKAFKNKYGLFVAALDRYVSRRQQALAQHLARANTGREQVQALLEGFAAVSHDHEGRLGCLVVGGMTDVDTFDAALAQRFYRALDQNKERFMDYLQVGVDDGSVATDLDVDATATYLLCVVEGLRILGKRGADNKTVTTVVEQTMRALG